MKSDFTHFLQQSFRALMPVVTAVCLSVGVDVAAQDNEGTEEVLKPASPAEELGLQVQDLRTKECEAITEKAALAAKRSSEGNYQEALKIYTEALKALNGLPSTQYTRPLMTRVQEMKKIAQKAYAEQLLQDLTKTHLLNIRKGSMNQISDKAVELSEEMLQRLNEILGVYYLGIQPGSQIIEADLAAAAAFDPEFQEEVAEYQKELTDLIRAAEFQAQTTIEAVDPANADRKKDISLQLGKGMTFYRNGDYGKARDAYEQVLIMDPFNQTAMQQLTRIYLKMNTAAEQRQYNEILRYEVQSIYDFVKPQQQDERVVPTRVTVVSEGEGSSLHDKLASLYIDVDFEEADINSVVTYLKEKSKELDPSGEGINFVVKIPQEVTEEIEVSLNLTKVPLDEVLRHLCKNVGLQYRVQDKTVLIGTHDLDDLETRFIKVRSYLISRVVGASFSSDSSSSYDNSGDGPMMGRSTSTSNRSSNSTNSTKGLGNKSSNSNSSFSVEDSFEDIDFDSIFENASTVQIESVNSDMLRNYFSDRGVPFDVEGATIAYDARAGKLTVTNTPDNLRKLETLIRELDVENPQVLVEAKILEVTVDDIREFGFDWLLTHADDSNPNWNFTINTDIGTSPGSNNMLINNMNILPNFGEDGLWNLSFTLNAIDRIGRTEVLATPRVIAPSGQTAFIQMVREMYFPESWEEPEVETDCGESISLEPSYPEFGEETPVGIMLSVTPSVSPNNYTIKLTMLPSVTDLTGWADYSYNLVIADVTNLTALSSLLQQGEAFAVPLKMPELSRREVETSVKVYDGQNLVIGGMVTEQAGVTEDRIPFLGDLPLIGRLFMTSYNTSDKSNLLISVTPRLMTGDGVPVRSDSANGLPEFR